MKEQAKVRISELISRYPILSNLEEQLKQSAEQLIHCYNTGHKVMVCGNGGSAADALHIVGELMKAFICKRELSEEWQTKFSELPDGEYISRNLQMAFPAISLVNEAGLLTAYANDVAPDMNFAQQVFGQGNAGDVLIAISTSGNSENVLYAAEVARAKSIHVIALTGKSGGKLKDYTDLLINVPESETFKIQELHLPVYHALCLAVEAEFYSEV